MNKLKTSPNLKEQKKQAKKNRTSLEKENEFKAVDLVKVIEYDKIKKGDIIIVECEKGKENEFLSKANNQLKSIINEKDLRILAITPDFDMFSLKHVVEIIKDICENQEEQESEAENDNCLIEEK